MTEHQDDGQDGSAGRDAADAALLAEIAAAAREAQDVPERYRRSAQAAFTWRTVDAELAELTAATLALTYDSALDDPALVRTTSVDEPRQLTFASPSLTLDVEVEADVLRGQLIPAAAGTATVEFGSGFAVEVQSDEEGMFSLDRPRDAGPVRIRCRVGDLTVATPWMPF
ncbi:hypothetical protein JL107_08020 [Nakamurella flavida]|uniref:Uncharacterized protein n=1 Tax=Nakamurella flavida TaxID=363630 RepID=A0A939C060_9ACTN|nr:hypothetical protein [Nakamurella flavida]MBM9476383.1 hypothetical protein [Nakamurella flavida]MDP9779517.1 hypothetical protein [Nakamurella flavida]